ncbi:patatin-like phospholipase family protein [Ostreiculturibacter nitratireducens]|uniref:patatin-like phospholipase family protein n=1 Tax=Ostreiculturibacter nitratireducens TaxID=3075226 RepID=UPI0031B5FE56
MTDRPRIGLALGAGGARGWCHIGVLRGLAELGVEPDMVAGCSMGALVAAAWAAGRLDQLEDWALSLNRRRFVGLVDVKLTSGGLVEGREIANVLGEIGVPDRFEDMSKPFVAIATDMESGREVWIDKGSTHSAVRASVAVPGVFSPHPHEGRWLLDGGLTNPVPVSAARAQGADIIIAANPNARPDGRIWRPSPPRAPFIDTIAGPTLASVLPQPLQEVLGLGEEEPEEKPTPKCPNYLSVIAAAIDVMSDQIRRARLAGEPPHILLNADIRDLTMLELFRAKEAIEEGRRMVEIQTEAIRTVCGLKDK